MLVFSLSRFAGDCGHLRFTEPFFLRRSGRNNWGLVSSQGSAKDATENPRGFWGYTPEILTALVVDGSVRKRLLLLVATAQRFSIHRMMSLLQIFHRALSLITSPVWLFLALVGL